MAEPKALLFVGSSREDLQDLPTPVKTKAKTPTRELDLIDQRLNEVRASLASKGGRK